MISMNVIGRLTEFFVWLRSGMLTTNERSTRIAVRIGHLIMSEKRKSMGFEEVAVEKM
jgi:hypothetical protein